MPIVNPPLTSTTAAPVQVPIVNNLSGEKHRLECPPIHYHSSKIRKAHKPSKKMKFRQFFGSLGGAISIRDSSVSASSSVSSSLELEAGTIMEAKMAILPSSGSSPLLLRNVLHSLKGAFLWQASEAFRDFPLWRPLRGLLDVIRYLFMSSYFLPIRRKS